MITFPYAIIQSGKYFLGSGYYNTPIQRNGALGQNVKYGDLNYVSTDIENHWFFKLRFIIVCCG